MKLYFSPGACSLSPHIALREAGLPVELVKVDLRAKTLSDGSDFRAVNPKGYVPAIQLPDGSLLTEGPAIVQYIADQAPQSGLAPAAGTLARYRLQETLNYISTELHKSFSPLFNPNAPEEWKAQVKTMLAARFDLLSARLDGQSYLFGDQFTVADGYLFTVLNWTRVAGPDLADYPNLAAYHGRILSRPAVLKAVMEEQKLYAKAA